MGVSRGWPLTLGAIAAASGTAMVTLDIIFAVTLSRASSPSSTRVAAIVASGIGSVAVTIFLILWGRQFRYRNGAQIQDFGHGRRHTYLLAGSGGVFGIVSAVASAVMMGIMKRNISELPKQLSHSSTASLIIGGFIVWAIALISQAVFIICIIVIQRKDFQQQIQPYHPEASASEMQESSRQRASSVPAAGYRESTSMESKSPPSSGGRSRSGSDTMASFRSSLTQVVRPITSKTKLVNHKAPYRPTSIESNYRDTSASVEDGFDSWDTSTVDAQSRQAVESASPTPRFLETIPASPTTSRSASPGFPLDLEPPKHRRRSRSYSPANSYRDLPRTRTTSPTESTREAHIHPLFRSDSPTPPPAATPGTIVTAAPGAGQVLSDRASVRSISRIRSGSLPSSPLMHSDSLDSIRRAMEREEKDDTGSERTLTPPIPDWVLRTEPRPSLAGYNSRKKAQTGLGIVGEVRNA